MTEVNIEINIEEEKWQEELPNAEEIIKKSCLAALNEVGILKYTEAVEVSILLTNDSFIQNLNRDYRHKDKPTNVLSFPMEDFIAGNYTTTNNQIAIGDIIFAFETIKTEAIQQKKPFAAHLIHLSVHGVLHLLGHDHENDNDAEIMESLEIKILSILGVENPY